ncbi:hypothetical protein K523DRAFT_257947 [Schizophyllum commune Tattone D]|nr:hypothetical protein K523DRAFT_257947 [Schizophyllum commune Tattone D]
MAGQIRAAPPKGEAKVSCRVCASSIAASDIQNHVGRHILRAKCVSIISLVSRSLLWEQVTLAYPCGFCGGPSSPNGENGSCSVGIVMHGKTPKASSSCPCAYAFKIDAASHVSKSKPCTNVPLRCPLCPDVHWKYNMEQHLAEKHPDREGRLSNEFLQLICITMDEKSKLGVPEDAVLVAPSSESSLPQRGQKRPASPSFSEHSQAGKRRELGPAEEASQYTTWRVPQANVQPNLPATLPPPQPIWGAPFWSGSASQQQGELPCYYSYPSMYYTS